MSSNYSQIPIINKLSDILKIIVSSAQGLKSQDIRKALPDIPKTTLYRLLNSMVENEILSFHQTNGIYTIGPTFRHVFASLDETAAKMKRLSFPYLQRLADELKGTVKLCILSGMKSYTIASVESDSPIRISIRSGAVFPLHAGASGKILLSLLSDKALESYFRDHGKKYTDATITTLEEMRVQLDQIRRRKYAVDVGEYMQEIQAVAVPVFDTNQEIIAAISVSFPSNAKQKIETERAVKALNRTATDISSALSNINDDLEARIIIDD